MVYLTGRLVCSVKSPQVLAVGDEAGTLHILQLPLQLW
jgi:hypothetical protein